LVENDKSDSVEGLVNRNLKFALKQAYTFKHINSKLEFGDIVSAANEGLVVAAKHYKPDKFNNKFITYARFWIFKYIHDRCIYDPCNRTIGTKWGHQKKCNTYNRLKHNTDMTDKEIQKEMKLTDRQFVNVLKFNISSNEFSLNQTNDESDEMNTIENYINSIKLNDDLVDSVDATLMEKEDQSLKNKQILNIMNSLNTEDKLLLEYHFFKNYKTSKIAEKLNSTNAKVKTKLKNILKMIKDNKLYENK